MCLGGDGGPQEHHEAARPVKKPHHNHHPEHRGTPNQPIALQRLPPIISLEHMDPRVLHEACNATGQALNGQSYALIGGAACSLLGSRRGTYDVDIIVPEGCKPRVVSHLKKLTALGVESGSLRTWLIASNGRHYNLDIIEPGTIQQEFGHDTETIHVNGIKVLKPALILNFKCFSWTDDNRLPQKKNNDARDINFLLDWMVRQGQTVREGELNFADENFFVEYLASYPHTRDAWVKIGVLKPSK